MTWLWVDPADVLDQVAPGGEVEDAEAVIAIASNILMSLTGFRVHPAGDTAEDASGDPVIRRLTPTYRPLLTLTSVIRLHENCTDTTDISEEFCLRGGDIYRLDIYNWRFRYDRRTCMCRETRTENVQFAYTFGSTVGPMGRRTVTALAHQLWLAENPSAGECQLPERIISVSREGVSWTVLDPMQYLSEGRTGYPPVDQYLATVNPFKGRRPSAVYTPDSPPGVGVA